ncbi:hypothetical protein [Mycolicibacterium pulveris]|uniref:hypothetical protein n=1 Tax=Mycolicibacterium pulveris TaxID=36813 RepID=UPI003CFA51FD
MYSHKEMTEVDAIERLLGTTYPWLSDAEVERGTKVLVEGMAQLDLDNSPSFTFELMESAEQLGRACAAELNLTAPNLGTSHSFLDHLRGLLPPFSALHRVGRTQ